LFKATNFNQSIVKYSPSLFS